MSAAPFSVVGLCAAPFTPFGPDGAVNVPAVAAHVRELGRQGVKYAFVGGTTGEGVTMSVAERVALLDAWVAAAAGTPLQLIAHVGAEAIADVQALAADAAARGAPVVAVAAHTPTFNKPADLDSVVDFLHLVSLAAPSLPLYYYHIAIKTGVTLRCDALLAAVADDARGRAPTFRGIKFTDFDLHVLANCVAFRGGAYDVLSGRDEVLLSALAMGVRGAVGSTYNYAGTIANRIIAAWERGDARGALAEQRTLQAVVDLLNAPERFGGGGANVGKAVMEIRLEASEGRGGLCGPPRYPGRAVPPAAAAALAADLRRIPGFFA